ncbi:MAG: bifunctional glycosyltransferase family 2/GtrA family protein [Oscillospiraceae bacterium]|nr:bifunctional glycosyltransferase family 2/GtrA family protein [Oscillospiraceae bacterium]
MVDLSNISVVLPSLDPDDKLIAVVNGLLEYGFTDIILVNDGSKPENLHYFETAAQNPQVHLLHHSVNRGKGAALKTAFRWFLENRPHAVGVVTVDGDNQHHPEDTRACALRMAETEKIILGVRDFDQPDVPPRSRTGNKITSWVFQVFVGMTISDTQTGLRAIPRPALEILIDIQGDRFEYETNMLLAMQERSLSFEEVKIRTVYIEENKSSHFRAVQDSWRIYKLILAHFFKYTASSLTCALADEGMYLLLTFLLHKGLSGVMLTAAAVFGARLVSSLLNFYLNRKLVFHSSGNVWTALGKYYALAVPVALLQLLATEGVYRLLHIGETLVLARSVYHILVMVVLYFISFLVQQRWVFAAKKNNQ